MGGLRYAVSGLAATTILPSARVGGLLMGSPTASALPPASGSNCNSNWVNNAGAIDCFIQGEEDVRNGVAHPHYVACTKAGECFAA
jgi:hypothetical protein